MNDSNEKYKQLFCWFFKKVFVKFVKVRLCFCCSRYVLLWSSPSQRYPTWWHRRQVWCTICLRWGQRWHCQMDGLYQCYKITSCILYSLSIQSVFLPFIWRMNSFSSFKLSFNPNPNLKRSGTYHFYQVFPIICYCYWYVFHRGSRIRGWWKWPVHHRE